MEKEFAKNKRGLSLIITILMIVLLIFVAIGIVWFVIRNVLEEGAEGISLQSFNVDLKIQNAFVEEDNISVNVKRNPGKGNLVGIKFIFYDGTESEGIEKDVSLAELDERTFSLALVVLDTSEVTTVSIAPIYESDSGERVIGDIVDTYTIGVGSTGGDDNGGGTGDPDPDPDPETCIPVDNPCGTKVCGTAMNGTVGNNPCADVTCGECGAGEICNATWGCEIETSINSGVIFSVWPAGAAKYFDSNNLPKDYETVDNGNYVRFPGSSETNCIMITWFEYLEGNDRSYVRLLDVASIQVGDNYEIWESEAGCLAAL